MTTPDLDQEKARHEQELRIQRQIAFASGLFQGDVTVRTLLESLAEGVVVIDNSGTILLVNSAAEQMFGYQRNDLIGKPQAVLIPERFRKVHEEHVVPFFAEPRTMETDQLLDISGRRRDGSEFPVEISLSYAETINGVLVMSLVSDITLRKEYETRLRESEELFRLMADTAPVLIWMSGTDTLCTFFNKPWLAFTGRSFEQEQGNGWVEGVHPDDLQRCFDTYLSAFNARRDFQMEYRLRRADGEYRWIVDAGVPRFMPNGDFSGYIGSCFDITERKRAEEALRESENKFSKAFQATPSGLVIASLADGRYLEVNEAFERVMGYRSDEVIGRSSLELDIWQNPEDRAIVLRMLAEGKKVRDLEIGFRSKSGTIFVGLYSAEIIEIGAEQCLVSLLNDITARKKAEEELRHSEERYRRLYNETPVMLHSIDHDGRLVSVSNYWLETLGYERSEVLGRISTEFYTAASRSYAAKIVIPEFFRTGSCKEVPYQIVKKNGEILDVQLSAIVELDSEGKVVRSLAVMVDVTARKRAEEALLKSEDKFARIFHAAPVMISISTLAEGRFIDVNEACLRLLGYQREELVGHTSLELGIWKSHADRDLAILALEERGTVSDLEVNLRNKTGETMAVLFSMELLDIGDERCMLSLINDITERKRAEEEIKRLNVSLAARAAELEDANRELEAFNYTVAHDLRQPLNVIGINCQAIDMLCGDLLPKECKGYVQGSYEGTLRMNRLIEALLNFSSMAHAKLSRDRVDLSSMAKEVAEELKGTEVARRVTFRIADGIYADGDPNLLRVVLANLLGNAWKYIATQEEGIIEFGATEIDGRQAFFVRDNGPGFTMADADKLFAPFQRLPGTEERRGFGIGLATVERIIRRHGGRVWAEGEPSKGATFYFTLGGDRTV